MATSHPVEDKLVREVLRKLRLATEADHKDDREVICGEVFDDINGLLDEFAQAKLGIQRECRFYEVLAPYITKKWDAAEGLLYVCRRLWGQPYVAPVYSLLLHQWLLLNREAGGATERQKHVNVMVSGARQLFWGDIQASAAHFKPLFTWLCENVVFSTDRRRLDELPPRSRRALLSCCAAFMAYYKSPEELAEAIAAFPSPDHTLAAGGHVDGEGADYVVSEVSDTLRATTTEDSLLRCLGSLEGLRESPYLPITRRITRLRLQNELYALTSRAGPRFISRTVNKAAFAALDALFPLGRASRRLVSLGFRIVQFAVQCPLAFASAVGRGIHAAAIAVWTWLKWVWGSTLGRLFGQRSAVGYVRRQQ